MYPFLKYNILFLLRTQLHAIVSFIRIKQCYKSQYSTAKKKHFSTHTQIKNHNNNATTKVIQLIWISVSIVVCLLVLLLLDRSLYGALFEYMKFIHWSHCLNSKPSGGLQSTFFAPTSFQFVLSTVPPTENKFILKMFIPTVPYQMTILFNYLILWTIYSLHVSLHHCQTYKFVRIDCLFASNHPLKIKIQKWSTNP